MNIPIVILAGGTGTRLQEETEFRPKPMINIGGRPMLWHIMIYYSCFGFNTFVIAMGHKQEIIRDYFLHLDYMTHDVFITPDDMYCDTEDWRILLADTGEDTLKGGRLKRLEKYILADNFMVTYGDGIGNVDINALLDFHTKRDKIATVTGVHPAPRFGELYHIDCQVVNYDEKPMSNVLVNGGFYVFKKEIFNYLDKDGDLEVGPLQKLTEDGQLVVYPHKGYWSCMDTLSDLNKLKQTWDTGNAPWKIWEEDNV